MFYDYCILGSGIAGVSAAETIRSRDKGGSIVIVGNEPHRLYSRVLLPHFVRQKIGEEGLFLKKPDFFIERRIDEQLGRTAAAVDAEKNRVVLDDGAEIFYGKLLIATGGAPRKLSCPGAELAFSFQTIEDARAIAAAMGGTAVVVGGGFIALEFIMSFISRGVSVTAVLRNDGFFSHILDNASKQKIAEEAKKKDVQIKIHSEARAIERRADEKTVHLSSGESLACASVGAGIGIEPNIGFLKDSGINVGEGVLTDANLQTSAKNAFAAGDAAEFFDPLVGARRRAGNWTNAALQGRTAGANMTGAGQSYSALTSYGITFFDLPITFLGAADVQPDNRIVRQSENGSVLQFLQKDDRVIGATCVGGFPERADVSAMITGRVWFGEKEKRALADEKIPLNDL